MERMLHKELRNGTVLVATDRTKGFEEHARSPATQLLWKSIMVGYGNRARLSDTESGRIGQSVDRL